MALGGLGANAQSGTGESTFVQYNNGNSAWSPDGSKIVFQASETTWPGSHIYVMNADGTNATRVTPPPTDLLYANYYPEWSPDGKKIAFGTAVGLGVVNPDGTGYRLFEGTKRSLGVSWTLDGKGIIFSRFLEDDNTYALYFINADGSGLKPLPAEEGAGLQYPELPRPSNKEITINQEKLYRIADSAEKMAAELAARPVQFIDPVPPELGNRKVAYVRWDGPDPEIWVVNLDGTGKKKLTDNAFADYNPDWSPDGKRIAFVSNRDTNSKAFQVYTMNANGTDVRRLTNDPSFFDTAPAWSPDGKKIAFARSPYENGDLSASRLYVMNANDGSGLTKLADAVWSDFQPSWSPDGSEIIYTGLGNDGEYLGVELFVIPAEGGESRQLTYPTPGNNTFYMSPSWSPKGDKILLHNQDGIATLNADGSDLRVLFRSEQITDVFWSPDGSKIIFSYVEGNNSAQSYISYDYYIMKADGTGLQGFLNDGDPLVIEQELDIGPLVSGTIDEPAIPPVDMENDNFCGKPSSEFNNVIVGTMGDDVLRGTDKNDLIRGLGGNDIIYGSDGADCLKGDEGNDAIWGGNSDDLLLGNDGDDKLVGDSGNDLLKGHAGDDNIWGGAGDDMMLGERGADLLIGDDGNDTMWGGDDGDRILGEEGNDAIHGNNGNDRLYGQPGDDRLLGGSGDDMVVGGSGMDGLIGDGGNDRMWGNDSDDKLYDDEGDDKQNGGSGIDECYDVVGTNTTYNCEK